MGSPSPEHGRRRKANYPGGSGEGVFARQQNRRGERGQESRSGHVEQGGGDTARDNWTVKSPKGTDTYTMWLRETNVLE